MTEVLGRVRNEEVPQTRRAASVGLRTLPFLDRFDVHPQEIAAFRLPKEAEMAGLQRPVCVVGARKRSPSNLFQRVAPDFGVAIVPEQDRCEVSTVAPRSWNPNAGEGLSWVHWSEWVKSPKSAS
jgi:hypothetical protein